MGKMVGNFEHRRARETPRLLPWNICYAWCAGAWLSGHRVLVSEERRIYASG